MTRKTKAPYLEAIEKHCSKLTKTQLLASILNIAKTVPQAKRVEFLEQLTQNLENNSVVDTISQETLIQQIRNLRTEVEERMAAIEDGSYYEEHPEEYYDEYSEEPPECITEEQKEALEEFFQQTEALFVSNQLEAAKAAFDELFAFDFEYLYLGIDLRETRARYCRCIYEICLPEQRIINILAVIAPNEKIQLSQSLFDGNYPFLQDIINTRSSDLPDLEKFLPEWEQALATIDAERANLLRLEAIEFMHGLEGVAKQAQSKQQPLSYLYWIEKLIKKKAWAEVASVAQEALEVLSQSDYRVSVAESLILAGKNQDDLGLVLKGKQEKFFSHPDDSTLLHWINEAETQKARTEALKQASKFLYQNRELSNLYIKVSLMAGEIDKAFVRVSKVKAFGWSHDQNSTGIVFAAILIALLPKKQHPTPLHQAILEYYSRSYSYETDPEEPGTSLVAQMIQGLRGRQWPTTQRKVWLEWAETIGKQRIEHIVSNKYRKAYQRAAEILGALAEYFILSGKPDYGISIIVDYRDVEFHRYHAFRREVDKVVTNSTCLRDKGIVG